MNNSNNQRGYSRTFQENKLTLGLIYSLKSYKSKGSLLSSIFTQ